MQPAARETLWIDANFRSLLERAGWNTLDDVMAATDGDCWRSLRRRENWRFDLPDANGTLQRVYLKKHHVRTWWSWLQAKLGRTSRPTPARVEVENVARATRAGIECMRVVAFGERFGGDGLIESFLVTEDLAGFLDLQRFVPRRFPVQSKAITCGRDRDLDRLVAKTAEVARLFHEAGYNHRDLYAGHFFVHEPTAGEFEIRLIDLQRMQHRRRFRRRWLVKDLAQLAWSAPAKHITCRHRMAFIRDYLGVQRLRPCDKRLVRAVLARQRGMQRKLGDIDQHSRPFEG